MEQSLADVLRLFRDRLSATVVDGALLARIERVCEALPIGFSAFWGLECRLGEAAASADVLFETKRNSPGHRLLAGGAPSSLDGLCRQWPSWSRLRNFARDWSNRDSPSHRMIRNVWLEFDVAAADSTERLATALGNPCIFWGPERHETYTESMLREMVGWMCSFANVDVNHEPLVHFHSMLPATAQMFQLGVMASRGNPVVRACVNRLEPSAAADWLARLDWPADCAALGRLLQKLEAVSRSMAFDLDITPEGLSGKLGVELYMDWSSEAPEQWQPLLELAAREGLCLPAKRDGILEFPGRKGLLPADHAQWTGTVYPLLIHNIHHLKFTFVGDRVHEAKAYLGAHRPGVNYDRIRQGSPDGWFVD